MGGKEIGVGVIGIGMGANLLFLNQDPSSRLEVRGLCSPTMEKVRKLAEAWHVPFWTTDYRELLARGDIQVIGVYSPDHLHAEHAMAALRAGKHVVCTKPMCTRIEDAAALAALVKQTGLKFLVGQTMRFDKEFVAAKRLYDDGDLGEIVVAEAHYVHDARTFFPATPWRLQAPQDLMYGGASHPIDLLRWFFGDVDEVHAYGRKGGLTPEYPYEDNYLIHLRFKSGVIARVLALYGVVEPPMPMMGLGLYGTKGSLTADFTDKQPGHVRLVLDKLPGCPPAEITVPAETEGALGHGAGVMRYMRHFEACLIEDKTPSPSVWEGAKSIAVCAAAWESIRNGNAVKVRNEF
ncbi:MAG TPA: Gfo/Idh/MocA family oxidoreductase [Caldilineaceae bacterium]|nr:Gfo/Idh/MocA family oxidoreductase [Caldilineaceae bacterium]